MHLNALAAPPTTGHGRPHLQWPRCGRPGAYGAPAQSQDRRKDRCLTPRLQDGAGPVTAALLATQAQPALPQNPKPCPLSQALDLAGHASKEVRTKTWRTRTWRAPPWFPVAQAWRRSQPTWPKAMMKRSMQPPPILGPQYPLVVASYHYWASTLFFDHHLPLLVVVTHPVARDEKPHPDAVARTPELHMCPVTVTPEDEADYQRTLHARKPNPPEDQPIKWLWRLQRTMYGWAQDRGMVQAHNCRSYRLRQHPLEGGIAGFPVSF